MESFSRKLTALAEGCQLRILDVLAFAVEVGRCLAAHLLFDPPHVVVNAGGVAFIDVPHGLLAGSPVETITPGTTEGELGDDLLHIHALTVITGRLVSTRRGSDQDRSDFLAVAAAVFVKGH